MPSYINEGRRLIEDYVIWLNNDLKLSTTCDDVRGSLLSSLTNGNYFSDELSAYFKNNTSSSFDVSSRDPAQVVVFKKMLNALQNTASVLRDIENINIQSDRSAAGLGSETLGKLSNAVHELYAVVQLINHSVPDFQIIIGPSISKLLPKIALASEGMNALSSKTTGKAAGDVMGKMTAMLPETAETGNEGVTRLNQQIFQLPHYFEELQKFISTQDISIESITDSDDYKKLIDERTEKTQQFLGKILASSDNLLTPSKYVNYVKILAKLAQHSSELLSTAAPMTIALYHEGVKKLDEIRHDMLPNLVAELEAMEESLALKPGVLTVPLIQQMTGYYEQLASNLNGIAKAAGVLQDAGKITQTWYMKVAQKLIGTKPVNLQAEKIKPVDSLHILQDKQFVKVTREARVGRFAQAEVKIQQLSRKQDAAMRFFDKLATYSTLYRTSCRWNLANLYPEDKTFLLSQYKQFQPEFAALHPETDLLIVEALSDKKTPVASYSSFLKELWSADHFSKVLGCKKTVMTNLEQSLTESQFKKALIEDSFVTRHLVEEGESVPTSEEDAELDVYLADYRKQLLVENEQKDDTLIKPIGQKLENETLFGRIAELKLSSVIEKFTESTFKRFLQDNLDDDVLKNLSLGDKKPPFLTFHEDNPKAAVYKKLFNALYYLQKGLTGMEKLHGQGDSNYIFGRSRFLYDASNPMIDFTYAKYYLAEAAKNPGLNAVIKEGMQLLAPLQQMPLIGDLIKPSPDTLVAESEYSIDIVAAWEQEQAVVTRALTGITDPDTSKEATLTNVPAGESPDVQSGEEAIQQSAFDKLSTALYQIAPKLRELNPDTEHFSQPGDGQIQAQARAFIDGFSGLSYGPESVKKILRQINEFNTQLSIIGQESRSLLMSQLIPNLGAELIAMADNSELNIGFKPGAFSSSATQQFNEFYHSLINSQPLREQDRLKLLIGTAVTQKRIQKYQQQLEQALGSQEAEQVEASIFGKDVPGRRQPGSFEKLSELHAQKQSAPVFTYNDKKTKTDFLEYYQEIQPYLVQIDYKYDTSSFLRSLRTAADFDKALTEIIGMKDKLKVLVAAGKNAKEQHVTQCRRGIKNLEQQLEKEKQAGAEKVALFKEKILKQYIEKNVHTKSSVEPGSFLRLFLNNNSSAPIIKALITDITIENKDIEATIASRVDTFFKVCTSLDDSLAKIQKMIVDKDSHLNSNPCYVEKFASLETMRNSLLEAQKFPDKLSIDSIKALDMEVQNVIKQAGYYDNLISMYAILGEMNTHLTENGDAHSQTNIDNVVEIKKLQPILLDREMLPGARLEKIENHGLEQGSINKLSKNADNILLRLITRLLAFFTGNQTKKENTQSTFRELKQEMGKIREAAGKESDKSEALSDASKDRTGHPLP